jgi:hypothetical protein
MVPGTSPHGAGKYILRKSSFSTFPLFISHISAACADFIFFKANFQMNNPEEVADANLLRQTLGAMCEGDGAGQGGVFNLCLYVTNIAATLADWAQACTLCPGICDPSKDGVGPLAVSLDESYTQCDSKACVAAASDTATECSCKGECTPQCRASFLRSVETCREVRKYHSPLRSIFYGFPHALHALHADLTLSLSLVVAQCIQEWASANSKPRKHSLDPNAS